MSCMESHSRLVARSLFVLTLAVVAQFASGIAAADSSDPTPAAVGPGQPAAAPETPGTEAPVKEDKRVFGVLPNYRTAEETAIYTPITSKQKLTIATKDTIDYPLFLLGGAFAGLAQVFDQHPLFGQGVVGFAHRYGTAYADQAIGNYMTEGFLPVLFHEDPRYFRRGHGPKWGRAGYAASRIFVTKADSGKTTFNFAEVVGNSIAAGVGNAYYPGETHLLDNVSRLGQDLATDAISQVLKEFWPDIKKRYWFHHKDSASLLPPEFRPSGLAGSAVSSRAGQ
jgi:hypothetical protein